MVKSVTVDSSVIISSLLPNEKRHEEACQIWGKDLSGETPAVMPDGKIEVGMRDAETLKKMLEGK